MYFVIRYNYINDSLTDRTTVGCFSSLSAAKHFAAFDLYYDSARNTVVIAHIPLGPKDYRYPVEVYTWSEYLMCFVPVFKDDVRRVMTITY